MESDGTGTFTVTGSSSFGGTAILKGTTSLDTGLSLAGGWVLENAGTNLTDGQSDSAPSPGRRRAKGIRRRAKSLILGDPSLCRSLRIKPRSHLGQRANSGDFDNEAIVLSMDNAIRGFCHQ
jgi:hypothetical protein